MRKQFPIGSGLNVQRRVDGQVVLGSANDQAGSAAPPPPLSVFDGVDGAAPARFDPSEVPTDSVDDRLTAIDNEIGALQVHSTLAFAAFLNWRELTLEQISNLIQLECTWNPKAPGERPL